MLDWNDLRYFLAVYRAGTLAGAAGVLSINATTVGRRLTSLEEQIATKLFDRTPGGFTATHAGRDLLPYAERMEREALALERELAGADQRLAGVVRLATTEMLCTRFLAPHLNRFHERHPQIELEIGCSARPVRLAHGDADVIVRLSRPREDDAVARRLASIPLSLYASRDYLAAHGTPASGDRLDGHSVILFARSSAFELENEWLAPRVTGARVALRSDSVSSIYAAALAGAGIALLPRTVADAEPRLSRLDTASAPEPRVIWQGVHRDLVRSARVQAVTGFLAEVVAVVE
jgi:DNA-binding transcriptional LysR family regulator